MCPWNRFSQPTDEAAFLAREGLDGPRLIEWMTMTQEEFSRRFKNSPIKRTKRRGLLRNVTVALGNWGSPKAVPALAIALHDQEPLVRGHAAWALGRIGTEAARQVLRAGRRWRRTRGCARKLRRRSAKDEEPLLLPQRFRSVRRAGEGFDGEGGEVPERPRWIFQRRASVAPCGVARPGSAVSPRPRRVR